MNRPVAVSVAEVILEVGLLVVVILVVAILAGAIPAVELLLVVVRVRLFQRQGREQLWLRMRRRTQWLQS